MKPNIVELVFKYQTSGNISCILVVLFFFNLIQYININEVMHLMEIQEFKNVKETF